MSDIDPKETQEWFDALHSLIEADGASRAEFILSALMNKAKSLGCKTQGSVNTPYLNTIPKKEEENFPGDKELEENIEALLRWNAMAIVVSAGKQNSTLGGHIGTFASSCTLYDVGFNHFWQGPTKDFAGDLVFFQGHSSPGIYARSYLEGRISEEQLKNFRQEIFKDGLSSYPHPYLMPDYWQVPTVSMGLGPLQASYQARFMKHLDDRGLQDTKNRKVWCFCGDGEMDEPESIAAVTFAGREKLDNLIFVINCNLQRLDGPVRGNSKIIQELEGIFAGASWNVIKVIWSSDWDELFEKDEENFIQKRAEECVDGEFQSFKARGGKFEREKFFGKYPELLELVKDLSDDEIQALRRGGHDRQKVFAAYAQAMKTKGKPTVILAKTIKGYGLGSAGESKNVAHNSKKMSDEQLKDFKARFNIPIDDKKLSEIPFFRPKENSKEIQYIKNQRKKLGGFVPSNTAPKAPKLKIPALSAFDSILEGSDREISTTMAFVRILSTLIKDKNLKSHLTPIVADEARTFGMEGLFRQLGIYARDGQLYEPEDSDQVMYYKESKTGQIMQDGLNEAGAFSSWIAAASSYQLHSTFMIPFYIYYSMFGFQRIGDLAWAAGDIKARGFLLGATSGRTTLNGEGLQHQDGQSHIFASTIPNCISYDPTFSYELAVIMHSGLVRMYKNDENVFYYISVMNENYTHPKMPKGAEKGIIKGMYLLELGKDKKLKVELLGCGSILREVIFAKELLEKDFGIAANIWSATSFNELARDGIEVERYNRLNPGKPPKIPYVAECLKNSTIPVIASTDYVRAYAEQIRAFIPNKYVVLGTDGFGRSDTRENLRSFFEVDRYYIAFTAIHSLYEAGLCDKKLVTKALEKYNIDSNKPNPYFS